MEVPKELTLAIELAEKTATSRTRVAAFAREMLRLLRSVEQQVRKSQSSLMNSAATGPLAQKVIYLVDPRTETLAEHRTSGKSNPFRCSKALYDAVAKVLAVTERPLAVEEIAAEAGKLLGEPPADFQLRVPLRLWLREEPPLITRITSLGPPAHVK
jgi:hypothetical protein